MKGDKLTAKQEAFCVALEIDRLTQRQAYIKAFGRGKSDEKTIDENASRLAGKSKVSARCEVLRSKVEGKAIWKKEEMLRDLKLIEKEMISISVRDEDGEIIRVDPAVRNVAIKAIERASKMLGYDEAEKVEAVVRITIDDDADELSQ